MGSFMKLMEKKVQTKLIKKLGNICNRWILNLRVLLKYSLLISTIQFIKIYFVMILFENMDCIFIVQNSSLIKLYKSTILLKEIL